MEFTSSSVVRLHRLFITNGRTGIYHVTRWGGKSHIATRREGVAAISALRSGRSVGEVEQLFRAKNQPISLQPLLKALLGAQLIRAVDGAPVSQSRFDLLSFIRAFCRFYVLPGCVKAIQQLPIAAQRWCVYAITYLNAYPALRRRARTADENIHDTSVRVSDRFYREYLNHLLWNIADTDAIFASAPAQATSWLNRSVQWSGLENLAKAQAQGKGVICAGFHFSATRLVAPLLLLRGLSVNGTATPSPNGEVEEITRWHNGLRTVNGQSGRFLQISQVDLSSVKQLLEALTRNEIVLTFPDMHTIDPNSDDKTRNRCAFFGIVRKSFQLPTKIAHICGVKAQMSKWVGWLAAQSGAPVLPVLLVRSDKGRLIMKIDAPIMVPTYSSAADREDAVNKRLFEILDYYIKAYPSQWFGWHRFHFQRLPASIS